MDASTASGQVCGATRKDGQSCAAYTVRGSAFCFAHCPERAADRREARSKGGRARHGRSVAGGQGASVELRCLGDVVRLVERAMSDVLVLENSVARARAVGYLCGIAVKALQASELEDRIARLEDHLEVRRVTGEEGREVGNASPRRDRRR